MMRFFRRFGGEEGAAGRTQPVDEGSWLNPLCHTVPLCHRQCQASIFHPLSRPTSHPPSIAFALIRTNKSGASPCRCVFLNSISSFFLFIYTPFLALLRSLLLVLSVLSASVSLALRQGLSAEQNKQAHCVLREPAAAAAALAEAYFIETWIGYDPSRGRCSLEGLLNDSGKCG